MTTPGPVAGQVVPTKAAYGGTRDTGAKSDTGSAEGETGFGEVLTKMQRDDASATAGKRAERAGPSTQEVDPQRPAEDGAVRKSIEMVLDSLAGGDPQRPDDQQSDPAQAVTQTQAPVSDIIAAVVAAPLPAVTESQPDASPRESRPLGSNAAAETMALFASGAGGAAATEPAAAADATPNEFAAAQTLAAATGPDSARAGPRAVGSEKGKSERKSAAPVDEPQASVASVFQVAPRGDRATPLTASVVRQEAHFPPVAVAAAPTSAANEEAISAPETVDGDNANAPSIDALLPSADDMQQAVQRPAQQIADSILTAAPPVPEFVERPGAASDPPGMKPVLKVLQIQLQPVDLGTVTVRMELKDAELSVQVEADRAETVDLIRNDQDTLSKLLRSAGYSVDVASVRVIEVDRTAASQQAGQGGAQSSFQSSPQSQFGASEHRGHPQRGSAGTTGGDAAPQTTRNDSYETNSDRAGRGLYL